MAKSCKTPKRCASLVRQAAKWWRAEGNRYTDMAPADQAHMRKVHEQDADDIESVAEYVARGDKRGAADRAWHMDTLVRDQIPQSVWCWMAPESVHGGCSNGRKS